MSAESPPRPTGIPVILLCAGYGTRLAAAAGGRPKPLLPVGGRPVLDWLLDQLGGLPDRGPIHLVANSRSAEPFRHWAAGSVPGIRVHDDGTASPEERLGAVGDLAFVLERLGSLPERALVAAGDNVFRFPLAPIWDRMRTASCATVLALRERDPERLRRTGVLELDADDRVLALREKPEEPPSELACPPFYLLRGEDLEAVPRYLSEGGSPDEIGRFVAWRAREGEVRAIVVEGRRLDVGTPESWRAADRELRSETSELPPSPEAGSSSL